MYAHLKGKVYSKKAPWVILELNGIGYEIQVPMTTFFSIPEAGSVITLFTHFTVREDAQSLFGFISELERDLFKEIIKVSGIGPKVALSILSTLPLADFIQYIESNKIEFLIKVPGIGKKTAERLVIELRDRIARFANENFISSIQQPNQNTAQSEAIEALLSLGFSLKEAKSAVGKAPHGTDCETILRGALQGISK